MSTAIAFSWPRRWRSGASISIGCLLRSLWPALLLPLLGGCPSGSARQPPSEDGTPAAPRGTTFSKSFGGDNWDAAHAAIATSDGGYAFVGTVNSTGDEGVGDLWISKLDANGNIDWQRAIGDITPASANRLRSISAVRATPDGGFILAGSSSSGQSPADADVWVAKLSSAGAVEWSRDYDSGPWTEAFASSQFGREARADDRATDVQVAPDGGFVVAASSLANVVTSSGQVHVNAQSIFVMRLTATGEVRWQRRLNDGPSMELSLGGAFSLIARPTHDEGAVVAVGLVASDRIRIVRLDSGGNLLWQHEEDGEGGFGVTDLAQTDDVESSGGAADGLRDDGFVALVASASEGGSDVLKLGLDGSVQWRRHFNRTGEQRGMFLSTVAQVCVPAASGGGFQCDYVAGGGEKFGEGRPMAIRLTSLGVTLAERTFEQPGEIQDIGGSADGSLIVAALRRDTSTEKLVLDKTALATRDSFSLSLDIEQAELTADNGLIAFDSEEQKLQRYVAAADLPEADLRFEREIEEETLGGADAGTAVMEIAPGSYVVGGYTSSVPTARHGWLLRITDGRIDWQRTIDLANPPGFVVGGVAGLSRASDGNVLVALAAHRDSAIVKVGAAEGNLIWSSESLSGRGRADRLQGVHALPDGGAVAVTEDTVIRLDPGGSILWRRSVAPGTDVTMSVSATARLLLPSLVPSDDGGFVVGGATRASSVPHWGAIKLDAEGNLLWSRRYTIRNSSSHTDPERPGKITRTADGGYVLAAAEARAVEPAAADSNQPFGQRNLLLIKIDRDGNLLWSRSYGGFLDEELYDLQGLSDGGVLVAGRSDSLGIGSEAWLLRLGPDGLVSEGCNAHLVSIPVDAFRVTDRYASGTHPVEVEGTGARTELLVADAGLASATPQATDARQCLGSSNPPLPPQGTRFTLTLNEPGSETGVVTSTPAGLVCGTAADPAPCSAMFNAGTDVFLAVDSGSESRFLRWEDCTDELQIDLGSPRCRVRMDRDRSVRAIFGAAQDRFRLRVTINGTGSVRSGDEGGIACGSSFGNDQDCEHFYDRFVAGSTVPNSISLSVVSNAANFVGWGGDCAALGTASAGNLTMNADKNCTATFDDAPPMSDLTVQKTGGGSGRVFSAPMGISCGDLCVASFLEGATVRLRASPDTANNSTFGGWAGCDRLDQGSAGSGPVCEVDIAAARTVIAEFLPSTPTPGPTQTLLTRITFDGRGSIASNPAGIVCSSATGNGGSCVADFPQGSVVQLIPTPEPGFRFVEWRQDADCADGEVTMNTTKGCEAVFEPAGGGGPTFTLSFIPARLFNGRVETDDQLISCPGASCSASYAPGTLVQLRAIPDNGRVLEAWTEDCDSFAPLLSVQFTINSNMTCGAAFVTAP